jgi:hypothetical protein
MKCFQEKNRKGVRQAEGEVAQAKQESISGKSPCFKG